jgi:hypothetical protein
MQWYLFPSKLKKAAKLSVCSESSEVLTLGVDSYITGSLAGERQSIASESSGVLTIDFDLHEECHLLN